MKTLVLADIHANEPALSAVLADAGSYDRLVFLGDLANFGTFPAECVDILRGLDPICVIGNHDEQIVSTEPRHFWDKWAKNRLSDDQQKWISGFAESMILDGHILLVHGAYSVDYDILPNTPDGEIEAAFANMLTDGIDEVWFGHYHYGIDRVINGVSYRCIRPVGHHRDRDTRAGYSVYENGVMTHKRVAYDLEKTLEGLKNSDVFDDVGGAELFIEFTANAYHEGLLKKDIKQMEINAQKAKGNI